MKKEIKGSVAEIEKMLKSIKDQYEYLSIIERKNKIIENIPTGITPTGEITVLMDNLTSSQKQACELVDDFIATSAETLKLMFESIRLTSQIACAEIDLFQTQHLLNTSEVVDDTSDEGLELAG